MTQTTFDHASRVGISDTPTGFGLLSRLNHWITAGFFLGALGLGLLLGYGELPRETAGSSMQWHKALGLMVLLWGSWRIVWRLFQRVPEAAARTPIWQALTAKVVHVGLLIATLAMPVSGIMMSLAAGRDLSVFGVTLLPALDAIPWAETLAERVHETAPPFILLFLILHIGGALKHHYVDRDATLTRMTRG